MTKTRQKAAMAADKMRLEDWMRERSGMCDIHVTAHPNHPGTYDIYARSSDYFLGRRFFARLQRAGLQLEFVGITEGQPPHSMTELERAERRYDVDLWISIADRTMFDGTRLSAGADDGIPPVKPEGTV